MKYVLSFVAVLASAGCSLPLFDRGGEVPAQPAADEAALTPLPEGGVRPQARPDGGAVAAPDLIPPPPAPAGALGVTVASLGNPAEPGLWIKTPLVQAEQPGRVELAGRSAAVTLIPLAGPATAGSRMSLAAFQALGASLTDLPEVTVFAG